MEEKDLLIALAEIEKNLQSLKSAKVMVEDTVGAYRDVKTDINHLLGDFTEVAASLKSLIISIDSENNKISADIQNSIDIANNQLGVLNNTFSSQCNSIVLNFVDSIKETTGEFKKETQSLTEGYKTNNSDFKLRIEGLTKVHDSLIKATESVVSLKSDIAELQKQLNDSQKGQDQTLEKIASDLQHTGHEHAQILSKIADDLKSSQDAQDKDLADIKEGLDTNGAQLEKITSQIGEISNKIDEKTSSIEANIKAVEDASKTNKILIIINVIITIAALIFAILK